ncbi:hypothetical protein K1T71_011888 [Dendrolimus kikuchii]|uniref:Uncharacterized protein n=1 Tax=Dendrolimus kikuchii TaxID=765133 RepID=A0ACC1CMY0_9NEOP|nr:hypothetical protein K1T71_011888 [Dendrolimus kikuchii]
MNKLKILIFLVCISIKLITCDYLENFTCSEVVDYVNMFAISLPSPIPIILLNYESDDKNWRSEILKYDTNIIEFKNSCLDFSGTKYVSDSRKTSYVINFRVEDFYYNFNKTTYDGLIYAEDNDDGRNDTINSIKLINEKLCDRYPKLCDKILGNNESAIQVETLNILPVQRKILHCRDSTIMVNYLKNYKLLTSDIKHCELNMKKYAHELEAVLSPKPFHIDTESTIPTVFYDCYTEDDVDMAPFVNTARNFCDNIEYVYLRFLKKMSWQRVAIISDYSKLSDELEHRLTKLFGESDIVYGIEKCTESGDDLKKTLKKLVDVDARIIILNTDKVTTEALFKQVNALNLPDNKYVWITKNFMPSNHLKILPQLVYNISPKKISVFMSISPFDINITESGSRSARRRTAHKLLKGIMKPSFIIKGPNYQSTFEVSSNGIKEVNSSPSYQYLRIQDMEPCALRSINFYNPCNDFELYLILSVLLLFSVALLVVTTFFIELDTMRHRAHDTLRLI